VYYVGRKLFLNCAVFLKQKIIRNEVKCIIKLNGDVLILTKFKKKFAALQRPLKLSIDLFGIIFLKIIHDSEI